MLGHVARMGKMRSACKSLVGELGPGPLGRTWCKLEDNIRKDLREIMWDVMNCIILVQCRDQWRILVNAVKGEEFD